MKEIIQTYKLLIIGKVQGVGFRYWFNYNAKVLNLNGYVKNLRNKNVEALIQGNINNIIKMLKKSKRGSQLSKVEDIKIIKLKENSLYKIFEIK